MAGNAKWRMTLAEWKLRFDNWIEQPDPSALMHASIFFDMRAITGEKKLQEQLQQYVLVKAQKNTIFIAHMTGNALEHRPPLGFFKNFVLEHNGEHIRELDLKKRGTIPVVDIARNYSLANGIAEVNTVARLRAIFESKAMSEDMTNSLIDAHEFIAGLRLAAQAGEYRQHLKVDNYLNPKTLSPLQRQQLKEAFQWVQDSQKIMQARFYGGIQ
jgi:CBS domain-containing protein